MAMRRRIRWFSSLVPAAAAAAATACTAQPADQPAGQRSDAGGRPSASAPAGPQGVYVATYGLDSIADTLPDPVYAAGGASGVYVRLIWRAIQPAADRFDWSTLDREALRAKRTGRRISIGVRTGEDTPEWVYRAGVPGVTFVSGRRAGKAGVCDRRTIPAPWAPAYQQAYRGMMTALAAHLKAIGAYDNVRIVKVTGINERSEETRVPSAGPQPDALAPGACRISNAIEIWQRAGYRPEKMIAAWRGLAGAVDAAFPDKWLAIAIIEENDFPSVDAEGRAVPKFDDRRVDVKRAIIDHGVRAFPGRFAVQWNGMNAYRAVPTLAEARQLGARIGMQSNMWSGRANGAGCEAPRRGGARTCTADTYRALLQFGLRAGASYLEIWPADATRFAAEVGEADAILQRDAR